MRIVRWIGKGVAGVMALAVVAIGGLYAQTQWTLSKSAPAPTRAALVVAHDSATLARGRTLAAAYGCEDCHAANLAGKVMVDDPAFGRIASSNLTAGAGGVLAHYDDRALDAAIRDGVSWDGRKLIIMPSNEYAGLADDDVAALIANLRSRPAVDHAVPARVVGPIARGLIAAGKLPVPYDVVDHARATLAIAPTGGTVEQGRYLASGCVGCHGTDYGGMPLPGAPKGAKPSANITPSGHVGQWSQPEFVTAMRTGVRPDGSSIDPSMPWQAFKHLSDDELQGVYLYLKTLPPKAVARQ
jgi:cytochrome c553